MAQQVSGRQPRYKRILLKLSGEALIGSEEFGIDPKVLDRVSRSGFSVYAIRSTGCSACCWSASGLHWLLQI